MDNARHADDEYTTQSTTYCPEAAHGNGMFSSSHHFTVTAQSLTNITKNIIKNYTTPPNVPSDVRMIPLGDIDLQHEIRVNNYTGEVDWWQGRRARVRRIYWIISFKSTVTRHAPLCRSRNLVVVTRHTDLCRISKPSQTPPPPPP
ncbi:hypothetical protein K438DRAFT_1944960 [Mycena galopus ATCC 62051]|nr:hypothetical protein K438DRAFT_1944960 [Mycena galopus ATCC 62051]